MQETESGVTGYTTGKKYSRTYGIPSIGYKYVGYHCDNNNVSLAFLNGEFEAIGDELALCYAYFDQDK